MVAFIKGKKVIISQVEVDYNGQVDAGEQCFAIASTGLEPLLV